MKDKYGQAKIAAVSRLPKPGQAATENISRAAFDDAASTIKSWPGYQPTRLHSLTDQAGECEIGQIHYKDESSRFDVGSFKALGAPYAAARVLVRELRKQQIEATAAGLAAGDYAGQCADLTLTSATDGNHGRALAWGCARFGAKCQIYIHAEVSPFRETAMQELGATVIRVNGDYDESVRIARNESEKNGWFVVSDTSWPGYSDPPTDVMAGYGMMVDEVVDQIEQRPTHLFVQGGVGGLAAGVSARLWQHYGADMPHVVVVEPELADCLRASAHADQATTVTIEKETMMAGLSCGEPSPLAWEVLRELGSTFMTIPDDLVAPTMRVLARGTTNDPSIEAGESAVAGLAGLHAASRQPALRSQIGLTTESRVLVLGTEGATDPQIYQSLIAA